MLVLVIEDDPVIAQLHADIVNSVPGMTCVARAHTAAAALMHLSQHDVDVLLLDMYLPDGSGIAILQQLRAAGRYVDVVMLTAADDSATILAARALGVRDYLVKPFTPQVLQQRLRRFAEARKAQGEALTQEQIDATFGQPASSAAPQVTASSSLRKVAQLLGSAGGVVTAQSVADALGMSRVSARRYLEQLVSQGIASVEPRYGTTGRPVLEYTSLER